MRAFRSQAPASGRDSASDEDVASRKSLIVRLIGADLPEALNDALEQCRRHFTYAIARNGTAPRWSASRSRPDRFLTNYDGTNG